MNKSSIKYSQEKEYLTKIIHDLKTPISAQIKALEIFLSSSEKNISKEEKDLIELTLNSCNYTQRLVENFNSICSLEKKILILNCENFNIVDLAKNAIDELDVLLKFSELKIAFNNSKEKIIYADKLQIKRVIINLLSNSINYAFKNTTIDIDIQIKNNRLFFEIKNKSPYIESEFLKNI